MKKKFVIFASTLCLLFLIKFSIEHVIKRIVISEVGRKLPQIELKIGSLSFSVFRPGITLRNIRVKQFETESGQIGLVKIVAGTWSELVNNSRTEKLNLSEVILEIQRLVVNPDILDAKSALAIKYMGLSSIEGAVGLKASINMDEGTFRLNELKLVFKNLFETNISLHLTGISKELLNVKPHELPPPEVLKSLEVSALRLAYFDLSGLARAMNLESYPEFAPAKETPESAKKKLVTVSKETDLKIVKFFTEYLQKPNTIEVLQDSESKLKIGLFKETYLAKAVDVADLLDKLGIHIYVESQKFL